MVTNVATAVRGPRVFYVTAATAVLILAVIGFGPAYWGSVSPGTLPPFLHVHAAVFLSWIVLLILQASLVARGRVATHRRLGVLGALLIPVMLVLGYQTAIFGARRGHPLWKSPDQVVPPGFPFADSLEFMIVPLSDLMWLAVFGAIAVWYRARPEIHRRAMLLAAIGCMVPPALTRLPFGGGALASFVIFVVFIAACLVHDYVQRGRIHPLNLWGGIALIASVPARGALARTSAWHSFAEWLVR
jgi:hypothetical protein